MYGQLLHSHFKLPGFATKPHHSSADIINVYAPTIPFNVLSMFFIVSLSMGLLVIDDNYIGDEIQHFTTHKDVNVLSTVVTTVTVSE